jgi:hypothetical protein
MQARRLADLADRQACLPCSLEAFASCLARFLLLPPDALKLRLSALHISARFLLFALGHKVETIRRASTDHLGSGRYHRAMAQATKHARPEVERRRQAAERMRGLFADLAPGRNLSDELIAERRAEARAEDREAAEEARRLRGKR